MPQKHQGWIRFQSSEEELQILEQHCQQSENQQAKLYSEFAEEDQRLAEEGLDEYAELLMKEDLQ